MESFQLKFFKHTLIYFMIFKVKEDGQKVNTRWKLEAKAKNVISEI